MSLRKIYVVLLLISVSCSQFGADVSAQQSAQQSEYTSRRGTAQNRPDARKTTEPLKITPRIKILSTDDSSVYIDRKIRLVSRVSPPNFENLTAYPVLQIIDPTTLIISFEGRPRLIRLQGLNQIEQEHDLATQRLRALLQGQLVYIDFDKDLSKRDEDGNLVAYVFRFSDRKLVNEMMIQEGLSLVTTGYHFEYRRLFEYAQKSAQDQALGGWLTE